MGATGAEGAIGAVGAVGSTASCAATGTADAWGATGTSGMVSTAATAGRIGSALVRSTPMVRSTFLVSAAAAGVPDAVTPSPPSTSSDTVAPPIASWRRDFGEVVNIFSLPFKSSMVWRWHAPDNARPCAAFTMAQA